MVTVRHTINELNTDYWLLTRPSARTASDKVLRFNLPSSHALERTTHDVYLHGKSSSSKRRKDQSPLKGRRNKGTCGWAICAFQVHLMLPRVRRRNHQISSSSSNFTPHPDDSMDPLHVTNPDFERFVSPVVYDFCRTCSIILWMSTAGWLRNIPPPTNRFRSTVVCHSCGCTAEAALTCSEPLMFGGLNYIFKISGRFNFPL